MAYLNTNSNDNTTLSTTTPFMDRLTHAVIKETSKKLRYYMDVKRRENEFVHNPNSTALDSIPVKARFMYGTTKEYPPLYSSYHTDSDVKRYLRSFQQQQKQHRTIDGSPEKQMCLEELHFHMRKPKYSTREGQTFASLRLGPPVRASSSCSSGRSFGQPASQSPLKGSRQGQHQLVDDTANILASMIKTRRSIYETNVSSYQTPKTYVSRNINTSPRQIDDHSVVQSNRPSLTHPPIDLKLPTTTAAPEKQKRTTENALEKAASIMRQAKSMNNGLLCEYKVSVTTGNCNGASTNAPILIKFYGTNGCTGFIDVVDSETHRVPFSKNQTDIFTIQTYHVGQLAGITIGHVQKDTQSGWFLSQVSIDDPIRDITYAIPCNAWLSIKSTDQKTMREFPVASMVSHEKHIESDEHRDDIESESNYSSTTIEGSKTSSIYHTSQQDQSSVQKRSKKHGKQPHVSIDSAISDEKSRSSAPDTNHISQLTVKPPEEPERRTRSPVISPTLPLDDEIDDNTIIESRQPTPTFGQSPSKPNSKHDTSTANDSLRRNVTDHERPPARLETRHSPVATPPERPIRSKEETNEDDVASFFDDTDLFQ